MRERETSDGRRAWLPASGYGSVREAGRVKRRRKVRGEREEQGKASEGREDYTRLSLSTSNACAANVVECVSDMRWLPLPLYLSLSLH